MSGHPGLSLNPEFSFDDILAGVQGHEQVIDCDAFDQAAWDGLREASGEVATLEQKGAEKTKTFPPLLGDLFYSLYKMAPELREPGQLAPEVRPNLSHLQKFMDTPQYKELRAVTTLDEYSAALGALQAGKTILEVLEAQPDIKQALQNLDQASEQAAQSPGDAGAQANLQAAAQQVEQALADNAVAHRNACRRAAEAAKKEVEETNAAAAAWGIEPGQLQRMPFDKKKALLDRLRKSPDLKRLADIVGRFRNLAIAKQRARMNHARDELVGVTIGGDLPRALSVELSGLNHPLRRLDTMRRWHERQLLQFELKAQEKLARGPLVVLCDSSGSTKGQRSDWIRAVALGLLEIAVRQKRPYAAIFFASANTPLHTVRMKAREKDPEKVLDIATAFLNGGTDFAQPLAAAVEILQEQEFRKGDVVMLTDGECQLPDQARTALLEAKERLGFKVWTVLVGGNDTDVKQWSDRVWPVQQLTAELAGQLFDGISGSPEQKKGADTDGTR